MRSLAFTTPLGILVAKEEDSALCAVLFSPSEEDIAKATDHTPLLDKAKAQILEYFEGKRKTFDIPLFLHGTEFQKRVWMGIRSVPYGKTISYGELSRLVGTKGFQAVGSACGKNPIPIIIPCHRIISADGRIGGFSGPMEAKIFMLRHEGVTWKE